MILLVDLCYEKDSLSRYEFVDPIGAAIGRTGAMYEVSHFTEIGRAGPLEYDRAILCGTALKDNLYLESLDAFYWIRSYKRPLLGICAGMQVVSSIFGGSILKQPSIGLREIEILKETPLLGEPRRIEGYHLHNYGVTLPESFWLLAGRPDFVEAFEHPERPIYGILFHPEVRNRWILERFVSL